VKTWEELDAHSHDEHGQEPKYLDLPMHLHQSRSPGRQGQAEREAQEQVQTKRETRTDTQRKTESNQQSVRRIKPRVAGWTGSPRCWVNHPHYDCVIVRRRR
jgi:hypothetical protein